MSIHLPSLKPPYPKWYNHNAHYDYHAGALGYTTKDCTDLKYKVKDLINTGELKFEDPDVSNVNANPLPNHAATK